MPWVQESIRLARLVPVLYVSGKMAAFPGLSVTSRTDSRIVWFSCLGRSGLGPSTGAAGNNAGPHVSPHIGTLTAFPCDPLRAHAGRGRQGFLKCLDTPLCGR